jgi:hypothetical protein
MGFQTLTFFRNAGSGSVYDEARSANRIAVSRIRYPLPFLPLDPGWEKIRIRIRDEQPGSYFRELKTQFFGLKFLNSLI